MFELMTTKFKTGAGRLKHCSRRCGGSLRTPGRRGRGRIRAGGGAVPGADVRHHGDRDRVLRRPDAGNRGRRLGAPDPDRPGADPGFDQARSRRRSAQKIFGLFDCANGVYVDVKTYTSFASVTMTSPVDASGNFVRPISAYKPGGPGDIVVVRLYLSMAGLCVAARLQSLEHVAAASACWSRPPRSATNPTRS